jgi:hypothetical protein
VARCCAFDPAEHHLAASRGMKDLMMFPAGDLGDLSSLSDLVSCCLICIRQGEI